MRKVWQIASGDVLVRVAACGICHSDAHYRAGLSPIAHLPVTPGHEVAGTVESVGRNVDAFRPGDRVCVHYLAHCGACAFCRRGHEQFSPEVQMIGKHRDGGYAAFIKVPARNLFALPDEIPFAQGAIMMCSSATASHALNKAHLKPGESVAIFGFGGLGYSALQLARASDCGVIYVVDINPVKLASAAALGAIAISATVGDAAQQIHDATGGKASTSRSSLPAPFSAGDAGLRLHGARRGSRKHENGDTDRKAAEAMNRARGQRARTRTKWKSDYACDPCGTITVLMWSVPLSSASAALICAASRSTKRSADSGR